MFLTASLAEILFWLAVVCCAVAHGRILGSVLRSRGRGDDRVVTDHAMPVPRRPVELAWAVVPAIALAAVLAATWRSMHSRG